MLRISACIQLSLLSLMLFQTFLIPYVFGLDVYGAYLKVVIPSMVVAALVEPYAQRDFISNKITCDFVSYIFRVRFYPLLVAVCIALGLIFYTQSNLFDLSLALLLVFLYALFVIFTSANYGRGLLGVIFVSHVIALFSFVLILGGGYLFAPEITYRLIVASLCFSYLMSCAFYLFFENYRAALSLNGYDGGDIKNSVAVMYEAFFWRGPLIYFNSLYLLVASVNLKASDIAIYKIYFSIMIFLKSVFPVNMPIFMSVVESGNYLKALKIIKLKVLALLFFLVACFLLNDYVYFFYSSRLEGEELLLMIAFGFFINIVPYFNCLLLGKGVGNLSLISFLVMLVMYFCFFATGEFMRSLGVGMVLYVVCIALGVLYERSKAL